MTVYVDELHEYPDAKKHVFRTGACHMTADTLSELHAMATLIGLDQRWFQSGSTPHYDLTPNKRRLAVKHGAVFMSGREQARRRIEMWRLLNQVNKPKDGEKS